MAFIYNLTDTWNDAATTWNGIKLAVTNSGSSASSNLLNLTVTGASTASFVVDKSGNLVLHGSVNKITMTAPATGATLTLADTSTFATSGAYSSTCPFTGTTPSVAVYDTPDGDTNDPVVIATFTAATPGNYVFTAEGISLNNGLYVVLGGTNPVVTILFE